MAKLTAQALLLAAGLVSLPPMLVLGANVRIMDYQSNCLDLPRSTLSTDAPQAAAVGTFPCNLNRQTFIWAATLTGLTNFNVTSTVVPSIVLSVPAVGTTAPTSQALIDQPAIGRAGAVMTWKFVANSNFPNKFNIVSSISPGGVTVALRSYPKRTVAATISDATFAPLFVDTLNVKDPQQVFTIQNV